MLESTIIEYDGNWLHELALNNQVLQELNLYDTDFKETNFGDLELLAKNCPKLVSLKVDNRCEIWDLKDFFRYSSCLEECFGGRYDKSIVDYAAVILPPKLTRLGLGVIGNDQLLPFTYPCADQLIELDLGYAILDTEAHCRLIERCPNLEILMATYLIGDRGLEVLADCCKQLRRLKIEKTGDDEELEATVTQAGLIALSRGCKKLEHMSIHVHEITNAALRDIGAHLQHLCDFRLTLLYRPNMSNLPNDDGVRDLLIGCKNLRRLALYLIPRGLTDAGLLSIGQHGSKLTWILLGNVNVTDQGLSYISGSDPGPSHRSDPGPSHSSDPRPSSHIPGCQMLQKVEIKNCKLLSQKALLHAASKLQSLRYFWAENFKEWPSGRDLLVPAPPPKYLNIELRSYSEKVGEDEQGKLCVVDKRTSQILVYHSLAGLRADCPVEAHRI